MTGRNVVPIETPEPPRSSIDALQAVLPALMGSAGIRQSAPVFAASFVSSPRSLSSPGFSYPVYMLGLDSVAAGASLGKAKLAAWRHEFSSGEEVVAAEVSAGRLRASPGPQREPALPPGVAGVARRDRDRQGLRRSVLPAAAAADLGAGHSRAVAEVGVALARRRRHPLAPTRPELTANRHYTAAEFFEALKPAAEGLLRAEAPGKGAPRCALPISGLLTGRTSMPIPATIGAFAIVPCNDLPGAVPFRSAWASRAPAATRATSS